MKLVTLQALVAAVEEGSLRGAARRINVSQPALTKMIRELEVELSAPLLVRTSKGVLLTAQGKVLYTRALKVSRELGAAVDEISQLGGTMVGELAIAAVPVAVLLLVPETLRTFGHDFPQIRLNVTEELYMAQLQRLRKGEVDVALCGVPTNLAAGEFSIEPLMTTRMVVVTRKDHPLAKARSLTELAKAKWVYTGSTADSGYAKTLYESHGLAAPPVGATVNSTLALLALIANGELVGLMPEQIARHPMARQFTTIVPIKEGGARSGSWSHHTQRVDSLPRHSASDRTFAPRRAPSQPAVQRHSGPRYITTYHACDMADLLLCATCCSHDAGNRPDVSHLRTHTWFSVEDTAR